MKILLIDLYYDKAYTSLTLRELAALTPKRHEVIIADSIKSISRDINFNGIYDLVGISCSHTYKVLEAYEIADEFRRRGVTVVLGGWHASGLPNEAKQHADSVVIGEAEETWPQLLKDLEEKKLKSFYRNENPVDLKLMPKYNNYEFCDRFGLEATRYCPMGCNYCFITNSQWGNTFRKRPVNDVIEEIKSINRKFFSFVDSSLTIDVNYTKMLFKEVKHLNKKFNAAGNIGPLRKNEELLKLASEAGCESWLVGFESISQKSIEEAGKNSNTVEDYRSAVKKIHDYGMFVVGNFMFGFDSDTLAIFDETIDMAKKIEIDVLDVFILTPFPNTPLYKRLDGEGRIFTKDWSKYDFIHVVFQPKQMSIDQLYENSKRVYKELYSYSNILKRGARAIKLNLSNIPNIIRLNNKYRRLHDQWD